MKILLCENISPAAVGKFQAAGHEVTSQPSALMPATAPADVAVLGVRSKTRLDAAVLAALPRLAAVGAYCIGTDGLDLATCGDRGVAVFNAPYANTRSVAELTVGEIIMLLRRVFPLHDLMQAGQWHKSANGAREARGLRLGIIGYGNIGSQVGELAESLGFEVRYFDLADRLARGRARRVNAMAELLSQADIVTVHVDGRPANRGLIGRREFGLMKKGALFLNLSRGFTVDAGALAESLRSGHLAGAAIDVFPEEPAAGQAPFASPLLGLPNVILTPHIAGSTQEAQEEIASFVTAKLVAFLETGATGGCLNLPELVVPRPAGTSRLMHLHRNVPGVLAAMNQRLAAAGLNIEQQCLQTKGDFGYVLTDVRGPWPPALIDEMTQAPHAVACRLLP